MAKATTTMAVATSVTAALEMEAECIDLNGRQYGE